MDLSESSFIRMVDLVYAAVEDPSRWRTLYEEVCAAIGSESVHVLALDKRHNTLSYSEGANLPVQGELAYMQHYRFIDPRMPLVMSRPPHQWMHCHESLDENFVANDPFFQEFLLPYDRRYASATKLIDEDEATVIFSTLRTPKQGPLPPEAVSFLDKLVPHLTRATRLGLRNFVYSHQALVGQLLVNKLRQPVVLMSPGGEVMHTNDAAKELMRTTSLVGVTDGRIRLAEGQEQELLKRCAEIERKLKSGSGDYQASFESLRITGERADAAYAFFTVLSPQHVLGAFGLRPVVMLLFYHPQSAPAIDTGLLYAVFGLTPAEARVATLLAEGLSLKEIARLLGTQHETVRKQLRSIYQKTSTNRQPELVRLLLHLPHNAIQP